MVLKGFEIMKLKRIICALMMAACTLSFSGCLASENENPNEIEPDDDNIISQNNAVVAEWFVDTFSDEVDSEVFTDKLEYQYYARALGLDKDYFFSADKWEVFYNADEVNRNADVTGKHIYLIRLNPQVLLEIYAQNNNCTVLDICEQLSVTRDQLYYNWGYTASSVDYADMHNDNELTYSEKENKIFGIHNGENREIVMATHSVTVDMFDGSVCTYQSELSEELIIKRRDKMNAFSKMSYVYSDYSENEKKAALTINGIGIRAVIPLSIPNAWCEALDADINVTPLFNVSPFSYGCTDKDKIDIQGLIEKSTVVEE